jgi:hypothetical protein
MTNLPPVPPVVGLAPPRASSSYLRVKGAAASNGEADAGLRGGSKRLEERRRAGRGQRDGRRRPRRRGARSSRESMKASGRAGGWVERQGERWAAGRALGGRQLGGVVGTFLRKIINFEGFVMVLAWPVVLRSVPAPHQCFWPFNVGNQ